MDLFRVDFRFVRTNCEAASEEGGAALNPAIGISTILFVPGSRPDRFEKALASGADCVCIDLEDAVAPDAKAAARAAALTALEAGDPRLAVRINGIATVDGLRDLIALDGLVAPPPLLFIPMVESAREVAIAAAVLGLGERQMVPLIESSSALRNAHHIAAAPGVAAMMFGGGDLSAQLGVELAWEPLAAARAQFVLACGGAGVGLIDVPFVKLDDEAGLEEEAARSKALGFTAKAAIHPAQVGPISRIFRPSETELAEARTALDAFRAGGGKVIRHRGRMLEAPIIRRYQAIVAGREKLDA
jgi:citrate lyase beta subunit